MNWLGWIPKLLNSGKNVAEVFTENKEAKGQRQHKQQLADIDRDRATLEQFAAEFQARNNRTWWDSFVDGLNRLPRPVLTIAILGFFILAPLNPEKFLEIARAYELMPAGYWALLSVIVGFYFGGRMQLKKQDMAVQQGAVAAAQRLVSEREQRKQSQSQPPTDTDDPEPEAPASLQGILPGGSALTTLKQRGTDDHGSGHYGAPRGDRTHEGIDYACPPGTAICAPIGGRVTELGYAYADDLSYRFVELEQPFTKRRLRVFYVEPEVAEGDLINAGDIVGNSQSLDKLYPGITEHVHIELREQDGTPINPETLFS